MIMICIVTFIALKTRDVEQSNIHNNPAESLILFAPLSRPTKSNGNSPGKVGNCDTLVMFSLKVQELIFSPVLALRITK